jgi:3-oxoacyl-[acyl-carrier protein] reductase
MNTPFSLEGRKILITGAAGGIGSATARACAQLGASLVLVDIKEPSELAEALRANGTTVETFAFDVSDRTETERVVASVGPLDAAVANAGYCPWDDWTEEGWDAVFNKTIDINLHSVMHLARAVLPGMASRKRGKIVLVSSVAGRMGGLKASPHYVAAKGGVNAFVKWLAPRAAAHGVHVNALAPGATISPMTKGQTFNADNIPLKRLAHPEEIAWPITFLCADASNYICGTVLDVNGGVYLN